MNRLIAIALLALSSTVSAEAITIDVFKVQYEENLDQSNKVIGGVVAFQETCNIRVTELGQQLLELVMYEGIETNYFFQEGFNSTTDKIADFGCWMAGFVVKRHEIGKQVFK